MKKFLLPNTKFFCAIPIGNNYISSIFGIEKKEHDIYNERDPIISRANKYLVRQEARLIKLAKVQDHLRFQKVQDILQTKSVSFSIACFNHKYPKWFWKSKGSIMKKIYKKYQTILKTGDLNLEYSRSWIPKTGDPYGRPIGAPTIPWRITEFQRLYFMDLWVEYTGLKMAWQHGGYKNRGVNTFMDQMITKQVFNYKYIWEFDLKGFFNNISQYHMCLALLCCKVPLKMGISIRDMLPILPTKYNLPPEDKDKALLEYKAQIQANWSGTTEKEAWVRSWTHWWFNVHIRNLARDGKVLTSTEENQLLNSMKETASFEWERSKKDYLDRLTLEDVYKPLMNNESVNFKSKISDLVIRDFKEPDFNDRAKGRDSWAGLGIKGIGTPQGVSWSPFITSLTSGIAASLSHAKTEGHPGIIMYMDDGLLFANTKEKLQEYIEDFKFRMASIGVELSPSKCGYVKDNGIWCKDLKILGTRYDHQMDWIFSSTRSGTVTAMPRPDYKEMSSYQKEIPSEYNTILEGLTNWLSDASKQGSRKRLIEWLEKQIALYKEGGPRARPTHEYGPSLDMTGKFLSHIWADPTKGDVKRLISEGQWTRIQEINSNPKSFFNDLRVKGKWSHGNELDRGQLTSISTDMVKRLFEWCERKKVQERKALLKRNSKRI